VFGAKDGLMSYPYSAFAVDLKKLAAAAGSKDKKLEAALLKKFAKHYAENAAWFEDEIAEGAPTLDAAVAQVLAGTAPKRSKHGFQYGYAAEVLVQHLGTRIDEDELGLGAGDAVEPFFKKAKLPSFDKLTKNGVLPMAIPKPANFPDISTMNPKDVAALAVALDVIAPLVKDHPAKEVADALRSWCTKTGKKKAGLVLFAY
jgi:hypothetical protein